MSTWRIVSFRSRPILKEYGSLKIWCAPKENGNSLKAETVNLLFPVNESLENKMTKSI